MKSSAAAREHRSEGTQHHAVTIESSGKAFRTLIDKLYSDKISSIVRELMTNAWDSHKMAGNLDTPFQVYSPTKIDPCFKVRDFGVGMDDETVKQIYGVFFRSTKDRDNEAAGMYGLGGKSPWSICSMYNLTCWDGEFRREYICAISEDDRPIVHDLGAQPDTQPRGVMVSVPAEDYQFGQFEDAIRRSSLGYDVPPTCNKPDLIQPLPEPALCGDGWRYFRLKDDQSPSGRQAFKALGSGWSVRMGPVIYPLTSTSGLTLPSLAKTSGYVGAEGHAVLIDVPIGSIEVTSSREQIDYKKETVETIQKAIEAVQASCVRKIEERIKDIESVQAYFSTLRRITPGFAEGSLKDRVHPFTGSSTPYYVFKDGVLFRADISDLDRGLYDEFGNTNSGMNPDYKTVFLIDASPEEFFILSARGHREGNLVEDSIYTAQERRFLLRQMRRIMLAREMDYALFLFTREVSQDFLRYFHIDKTFIPLSVEEFRSAPIVQIKREGSGRRTTPSGVRGLRLVEQNESGHWKDPQGVSAWEEVDTEIPYFDSEDWGHRDDAVKRFAAKLDLPRFYLASPTARERIASEGSRHALSVLQDRVKEATGLSLIDWLKVYGEYHNGLQFSELFHLLRSRTPEAYSTLLSQRNEIARYARILEKFAFTLRDTPLSWELWEHERAIVCKYINSKGIKHTAVYERAAGISSTLYSMCDDHPVSKLLKHVTNVRDDPSPEVLRLVPDMVRELLAVCPLKLSRLFSSKESNRETSSDFISLLFS